MHPLSDHFVLSYYALCPKLQDAKLYAPVIPPPVDVAAIPNDREKRAKAAESRQKHGSQMGPIDHVAEN
ncbi:unnamed protein product, partial [Iphiclides podalirius]